MRPQYIRNLAGLSLLALTFSLSISSSDAQGTSRDFGGASAVYKKSERRPSLAKRWGGIQALAQTHDPRAVELLKRRYTSRNADGDLTAPVRNLIGDVIYRRLAHPNTVEGILKWGLDLRDPEDAWLQFNAFRAAFTHGTREKHDDMEDLEEVLLTGKRADTFERASALEAFARDSKDRDRIFTVVGTILEGRLPKHSDRDDEREVLVESCASALYYAINRNLPRIVDSEDEKEVAESRKKFDDELKKRLRGKGFVKACRSLIDQFDNEKTSTDHKLVLARYLKATLHHDSLNLAGTYWRRILMKSTEKDKSEGGGTASTTRFAGVEGSGKRIAYLIDVSSSMEERVSKSGNIDGIDWSKIKTRMDLARAALSLAISELKEDMHFTVVLLEDTADYLEATPGMVTASDERKAAAIKEINEIDFTERARKARPNADPTRETNVHGAFLKAFAALGAPFKEGKRLPRNDGSESKAPAHSDMNGMLYGCDTIFLLSDGAPSRDNYQANDTADGNENIVGKEDHDKKGSAEKGQSLNFYGPYANARTTHVRDIERMNLFRKVEINCIGIGEAREGFLSRLSQLGLGNVKMLGN